MSGQWIDVSPRGVTMPIDCVHRASFGRAHPELADLPRGWKIVVLSNKHPDVHEFPIAEMDELPLGLLFLEDPDGVIRATWDEGRWWTPEESRAWTMMLQVPGTYVIAEGMREASMPRWWRRRKRT